MVFGGVDGPTFGCFLLNLIKKYPVIIDPRHRYVLVFHNASIHKSKKLKNLLTFMNIHFTVPYSSFTNSIEEFFALAKFYYRRSILGNRENLDKNIVRAYKKIEMRHFYSWYYHILEFADACF